MKRLFFGASVFGLAAFLGGCPVYSGGSGGGMVCNGSGCYDCPNGTYSDGTCIPWQCSSDSDCSAGYVCGAANTCVPAQQDDAGGDCRATGCPPGFVCKLAGGVTQCVPNPGSPTGGGDDGGEGAGEGGATDGSPEGDAAGLDASPGADAMAGSDGGGQEAGPSDAAAGSDGTGSSADAGAGGGRCNADGDCGQGAKCIDGECLAQSQLCSDTTQCNTAGEACVDGICEPRCSASVACPAGYACDFPRGVCNINPGACSATAPCQGGSACVEGHCAPPCVAADGGAVCLAGEVCVNGGCIPDQAASFACHNDGQSGQLATTCASNSVCLHHDCYLSCVLDAGSCPGGQTCKGVTIAAGTFAVCGATSDLGSDCDPAAGKPCATGGVCIDGYCK